MTNTIINNSFSSLTLPDGRPLTLPSGAQCDNLDRFELASALVALGVSGVDAGTGISDSLRLYSEHLETIKAAAVNSYSAQAAANEFAQSIQDTQGERLDGFFARSLFQGT